MSECLDQSDFHIDPEAKVIQKNPKKTNCYTHCQLDIESFLDRVLQKRAFVLWFRLINPHWPVTTRSGKLMRTKVPELEVFNKQYFVVHFCQQSWHLIKVQHCPFGLLGGEILLLLFFSLFVVYWVMKCDHERSRIAFKKSIHFTQCTKIPLVVLCEGSA